MIINCLGIQLDIKEISDEGLEKIQGDLFYALASVKCESNNRKTARHKLDDAHNSHLQKIDT